MATDKITWRIYYSNGIAYDSSMGDPELAPGWDVQVIAEVDPDIGRRLHSRADYYLYIDGRWVGMDFIGLVDHLANVLKIVKVGRMIDRGLYRALLAKAFNDPELPRKSGWHQDEPRG